MSDTTHLRNAYITGMGKFLPGKPVSNDEMEEYLGVLGEKGSRVKARVLRDNGIKTRYYALDKQQKTQHQNADMAAWSVQDALKHSGVTEGHIEYLATATSQSDLPLPGFASQVHSRLKIDNLEIASFQSICSSSLMALKGACQFVRTGEGDTAAACAAEMPSRLFKASRFQSQADFQKTGRLPFEAEFLRWMLSDGAGACVVQNRPKSTGLSLRVDWIKTRSYANHFPLVMYVGGEKIEGVDPPSWLDFGDYAEAADRGHINLRQDVRLLPEVIKQGVDFFFDLVNKKIIDPAAIRHALFHYSSEVFRGPIVDLLHKGGVTIPDEKWFTNLHSKGNTGSASIFIMLEELFNERKIAAGEKILCMVPESGRFNIGFMQLTVVDASDAAVAKSSGGGKVPYSSGASQAKTSAGDAADELDIADELLAAPELHLTDAPLQQKAVRDLTRVWIDFERRLRRVPLLQRLENETFTVQDYRDLLKNLRAQVVDGSRWITRAASNLTDERLLELRSLFIHHAKEEHRDYTMLERNFASVGGELEDIQKAPKNVGSEALSAWILQKASRENPIDLLGAMFIIEGLGNRVAFTWGNKIKDQLKLKDEQVSFLLYHGENDHTHFEKLEKALSSDIMTEAIMDQIVKTAKVTARLYQLQLEELNHY